MKCLKACQVTLVDIIRCNMVTVLPHEEVMPMKMKRLNIQLPVRMKAKLDALRKEGTSASGFIRRLLEREFKSRKDTQS